MVGAPSPYRPISVSAPCFRVSPGSPPPKISTIYLKICGGLPNTLRIGSLTATRLLGSLGSITHLTCSLPSTRQQVSATSQHHPSLALAFLNRRHHLTSRIPAERGLASSHLGIGRDASELTPTFRRPPRRVRSPAIQSSNLLVLRDL